jgi:hypothetical protein
VVEADAVTLTEALINELVRLDADAIYGLLHGGWSG